MTVAESELDFRITTDTLYISRASYGVFIVRIGEKIDRAITVIRPHVVNKV